MIKLSAINNTLLDRDLISTKLDLNSVYNITKKDPEFATQSLFGVYGFRSCFYGGIKDALDKKKKIRTIDYKCGYSFNKYEKCIREVIDNNRYIKSECKSGIVNMVLENYKREKEAKLFNKKFEPIILLFSVSREDWDINLAKLVAERNDNSEGITVSELRRCYKLCIELETNPNPELREIARIAKKQ